LGITVSPLGAGTVARDPVAQWYGAGEEVDLTATPEAGYTFASWGGDLSGTLNTQSITMDGPKTVTAIFEGAAPTVTLTINSAYGSPDPPVGTHNCVSGAEITLSAGDAVDPGTGTRYACSGWADGTGDILPSSGTETSHTFTIALASAITWTWRIEYRLMTSISPEGGGTITRNPNSAWYAVGEPVALTAGANLGFEFFNWSGDLTSTFNPQNITMDAFKRVTANFTGGTFYTLTVSSLHGSPDPPVGTHNVLPGTQITVSVASPVEVGGTRYTCIGWSGGSGNIPPAGTGTSFGPFGITQNSGLTWEWMLKFHLAVNVGPALAGTVTVEPEVDFRWYEPGILVTLTATPAEGYSFICWSGDPVYNPDAPNTPETVEITMNGPKTVAAYFSHPLDRTWWHRAPAEGATERPSARYDHAMVYASLPNPDRDVVVLFGGNAGGEYQNDTWEWSGSLWTRMDIPEASRPPVRFGHSLAYDSSRRKVVLFGGHNGSFRLNDTWEYDGVTWTQVFPSGSLTPRYHAAMAYDPVRGEVVLFGGNPADETPYSKETWVYKVTGTGATWSRKWPSTDPTERNAAAMVFDYNRGVILLHGGQVGWPYGDSSEETYEWSGSNWSRVSTSGPSISGHAMANDPYRGRTVLFGGWEGGYAGFKRNDTWEWNGSTRQWTKMPLSYKPVEREWHSMAYHTGARVCVLFGGSASAGPLNDTWEWNGVNWRDPISNPPPTMGCTLAYDSNRSASVLFGGETTLGLTDATWEWHEGGWTQGVSSTSPPPGRKYHAAAFDAAHLVTVIFGGEASSGVLKNDTWTWNGSAWSQKSPAAPPARYGHAMVYDSNRGVVVMFGGYSADYLCDTWEWDGGDGTNWTEKAAGAVPKPSARLFHAMAYDSARGVVVLFGGYDGADENDTWEWDGANWTERADVVGPPPRSWHSMAYDSSRSKIVLFGGSYGAPLEYLADTWEYEYDGTSMHWVPVITGSSPSARDKHVMCYDASSRSATVLFGGYDGGAPEPYKDDTWEY
jgi:hypothetical protein